MPSSGRGICSVGDVLEDVHGGCMVYEANDGSIGGLYDGCTAVCLSRKGQGGREGQEQWKSLHGDCQRPFRVMLGKQSTYFESVVCIFRYIEGLSE